MLALIQRLIVAVLVAAEILATALAIVLGRSWMIFVVPVALVCGYASVIALELALLRRSYGPADPIAPSFTELARAWLGEIIAGPRAFLWRQPFLSNAVSDHASDSLLNRRGVVWVHGFFCNRAIWNPWLRRLTRDGVPFIAVNLEPVFGSIDDYRSTIAAAVDQLRETTSLAPIVVAHSMGGLAVRAWLATEADIDVVHRVVTIASPHDGTRMAGTHGGQNVSQMRIDNPWLSHLRAGESAMTRSRFICFWGHCDNIVFPTRNATLPDADNRHLCATAHVQMALHPEVIETVLRLVA